MKMNLTFFAIAIAFSSATSAQVGTFSQIGLGTSSPTGKIDILSSANWDGLRLEKSDDASKNWLSFTQGNGTNTMRLGQISWQQGVGLYVGSTNPATPGTLVQQWHPSGNVGIGTSNISDVNYKLFVETGIRTRKLRVDMDTWPDYVFSVSHKRLGIHDLEKYIQANSHLPGVPSASEVTSTGLDLGEGQKVLMEKVEELTLYIIELQRQIDELKTLK